MQYLFSKDNLRKLILPLVLEQTLAITVGMIDTMMVSSVGEAAVSGVSLVDMINNLIFTVLAALGTGGAVVVSQLIGSRRKKEACHSSNQLLYTVLVISLIIMCLTFFARKAILSFLFGNIEADVMQAALIYFVVSIISYPFLGIYNGCAALYRSMGMTKVTFNISLFMNGINILGNAICVFGLHMGVLGVALPTLLSRIVGALVLFVMLGNPSLEVHFERGFVLPDFNVIRKILYIGIPTGIEGGIFQFGRVIVVSIIAGFGTVQIAANGVANSLDSMGCIVGQALGLAMVTVIGRCVGAHDEEQIRYYTKKLLFITYAGTICVNTMLLLFLRPLLSVYGLSAETAELAWLLVMIHNGTAMLLWPMAFVLPNALKACNDVTYPMVVSISSMFVFRIGLSIILGQQMGMAALGVWLGMLADWVCRAILFVYRYAKGSWKRTACLEEGRIRTSHRKGFINKRLAHGH